jgi:hypothetical protein
MLSMSRIQANDSFMFFFLKEKGENYILILLLLLDMRAIELNQPVHVVKEEASLVLIQKQHPP